MKVKKLATVFLTLTMVVGLMSGCGTTNESKSASDNDSTTTANETKDEESGTASEGEAENATASTGDGKTLVVYYSATGNTKDVAETIADVTGADLFEIEPKEPYTNDDLDWTDDNSRVSKEHCCGQAFL